MKASALPGFRDFYPDDLALRNHIFATWRAVATRYGFEEYDGPPLEPLELYTAKSGAEIEQQLYAFEDKGGRKVSLRPEMTPTLARMVAARANGLRKPIRWFSIPQLFRYERQQRGRLREHFQLNCDLIGEPGPLGDAEIIALAIDVMRAFGLGPNDVRVRVSDRRVLSAVLQQLMLSTELAPVFYQALDKVGRPEYAALKRDAIAKGVSISVFDRVESLAEIRTWDQFCSYLGGYPEAIEAGKPVSQTLAALGEMGLLDFVDFDPRVVRGLAYYTGTVFELFDKGRTLRAICGGGRYDNLLAALGGVDLPALGFGMGDVVLSELLEQRGLNTVATSGLDVFIAAVTADDQPELLALAHDLRDAGLRVEYALGASSVRKQLELADARRSRYAVVLGPDERARGEVILRDLEAKAQRAVARDAVVGEIVGLAGQGAA